VGIPVPSHGTLPSSLSRRMEQCLAGDQSSLMYQHMKSHHVLHVCSSVCSLGTPADTKAA